MMNIKQAIRSKQNISYKGSLKVECQGTKTLDLKKRYGHIFHATNECLINSPCDDVLVVSLTDEANVFVVHTDRNPNHKLEIPFKDSTLKITYAQRLIDAFYKLSSGEKNILPPEKGDIIAISENPWRKFIRAFTKSDINHVGIMCDDKHMIEALRPTATIIGLTERLEIDRIKAKERGRKVYILRLSPEARKALAKNTDAFEDSIERYRDARFSISNVLRIAGSKLGISKPPNETTASNRIICSELVGKILKAANILPANINASGMTPGEFLDLGIYYPSLVYSRVTRIK